MTTGPILVTGATGSMSAALDAGALVPAPRASAPSVTPILPPLTRPTSSFRMPSTNARAHAIPVM
jgi:hypothetical protein